jgi:parallel beta-helix repeat protein
MIVCRIGIVTLLLLYSLVASATIRYVKPLAVGQGNGSSWANASNDLQAMMNASASNDEVWVAAGTYMPQYDPSGNPNPKNPRNKTFYLKNTVKTYGGFFGDETKLSERHGAASILSGDIGKQGDKTDNAYHVVVTVLDEVSTLLDGFTIADGYANAEGHIMVEKSYVFFANGAGIYYCYNTCTSITNCIIQNNETAFSGGGLFADVGASLLINSCIFRNNKAKSGAGCLGYGADITIANSLFDKNESGEGGAIAAIYDTKTYLNNCIITNNTAIHCGGGLYFLAASTTQITHCTITNNSVKKKSGSAIYAGMATAIPILTDCKIADNLSPEGGEEVTYELREQEKQQQILLKNTEIAVANRLRWYLIGGLSILTGLLLLLWRQYRANKKANEALKIANDKLETLMRELHHRVKNNLQIVSSLLNLQTYRMKDPDAIKALQEGKYRVEAMALIHQHLYQTDDMSRLDIKAYTINICESLMRAYGYSHDDFDLTVDVPPIYFNIDSAIPIGLILNELVTNSFKYAYKDVAKPALTIRLTQEGLLTLHIKDNGTSLTKEDWESKSSSFGKQLITSLTHQISGKLSLDTEGGTHFEIILPITILTIL